MKSLVALAVCAAASVALADPVNLAPTGTQTVLGSQRFESLLHIMAYDSVLNPSGVTFGERFAEQTRPVAGEIFLVAGASSDALPVLPRGTEENIFTLFLGASSASGGPDRGGTTTAGIARRAVAVGFERD